MKLWAKTLKQHKITSEVVQEFSSARPSSTGGWHSVLTSLCEPLDISVPVILNKHVRDFEQFHRAVFKRIDFMEPVPFDSFEVEIFPEKKKESEITYQFGKLESAD